MNHKRDFTINALATAIVLSFALTVFGIVTENEKVASFGFTVGIAFLMSAALALVINDLKN